MLYIEENLLRAILLACREAFPNEFFSLLGGRKRGVDVILDHFVWVPNKPGKTSVVFNVYNVPPGTLASVHSHPFAAKPSLADIRAFPFLGEYHIIVSYPFRRKDVQVFDARGRRSLWNVWVREPGT